MTTFTELTTVDDMGKTTEKTGTIIPPPQRGFIQFRALVALAVLAVFVAACGLWGGVIAPSVSLGECVAKEAALGPFPSFGDAFAAVWNACKGLVADDAIAVLDAIIGSASPHLTQFAAEARAARGNASARAGLVAYAKAKAARP